MPQYRKLHGKIRDSDDVNEMPDDFTRLLWTWLILVLDREGRGIYNAQWIRSKVFPLRQDVTNERVSSAMEWYRSRDMLVVYTSKSRDYFFVPSFHEYQGDTKKEAVSVLPGPDPDLLRTYSRPTPDQTQRKSSTDLDSDSNADANTNADADSKDEELPPSEEIAEGDLAPYEIAFVQETGLPLLSGGPERWFRGLKRIKEEIGATPDDFREGIRVLVAATKSGKSYNLSSPESYVNATANIVAKRNAHKPTEPVAVDPDAARLRQRQAALYGGTA
jgi:hypothetical protein